MIVFTVEQNNYRLRSNPNQRAIIYFSNETCDNALNDSSIIEYAANITYFIGIISTIFY